MRRTDQRRDAVFALYQHRVTGRPLAELLNGSRRFTRELVEGSADNLEQIDAEISDRARGWAIERIAPLELGIMRVALYELRHTETPPEVVIDEAVNLAREYCGSDAPGFVNGILGAAVRDGSAT